MIYLIKCDTTNSCKIGYSDNPLKRLGTLQTGNPYPLELISTIEGDLLKEKELHQRFSHLKLQGEWFDYSDEVKEFFEINENGFITFNQPVMKFLKEVLPAQEIGRIYNMSSLIQTNWNLLVNDSADLPFDDKSLSEEIALSRNKYHDFMQKMYKLSIVYKLKGYYNGSERTLIILNPFLAKNTKTIKKELLPFFENLSKKSVQDKLKLTNN